MRRNAVVVPLGDMGFEAALNVSVQESDLGVSAAAAPVASSNQ